MTVTLDMLIESRIATIIINNYGYVLSQKLSRFFRNVTIYTTYEIAKKYNLVPSECFITLRDIFKFVLEEGIDTVAFMAAGIAVREIHAVSKYTDPAIVLVDNMGRYSISLMSGHEGGANFLAYKVASLLGAEPIITTFAEVSKRYILGIGCRKGMEGKVLAEGIKDFLKENKIDIANIRHFATSSLKLGEKGLWQLEELLGIPIYFVPIKKMTLPYLRFNESLAKKYFPIPSVAEASALLSGKNARLLIPKTNFKGYTLALSEEDL